MSTQAITDFSTHGMWTKFLDGWTHKDRGDFIISGSKDQYSYLADAEGSLVIFPKGDSYEKSLLLSQGYLNVPTKIRSSIRYFGNEQFFKDITILCDSLIFKPVPDDYWKLLNRFENIQKVNSSADKNLSDINVKLRQMVDDLKVEVRKKSIEIDDLVAESEAKQRASVTVQDSSLAPPLLGVAVSGSYNQSEPSQPQRVSFLNNPQLQRGVSLDDQRKASPLTDQQIQSVISQYIATQNVATPQVNVPNNQVSEQDTALAIQNFQSNRNIAPRNAMASRVVTQQSLQNSQINSQGNRGINDQEGGGSDPFYKSGSSNDQGEGWN